MRDFFLSSILMAKKIYILIKFFLPLVITISFISCKKQEIEISYTETQTPVNTPINKTFWNDSMNGFFCGGEKGSVGYIFRTIDGGSSWQNVYSNSAKSLAAVFSPIPFMPGILSTASPIKPKISITWLTFLIPHLAHTSCGPIISMVPPW